jgi:hypothetical protein
MRSIAFVGRVIMVALSLCWSAPKERSVGLLVHFYFAYTDESCRRSWEWGWLRRGEVLVYSAPCIGSCVSPAAAARHQRTGSTIAGPPPLVCPPLFRIPIALSLTPAAAGMLNPF